METLKFNCVLSYFPPLVMCSLFHLEQKKKLCEALNTVVRQTAVFVFGSIDEVVIYSSTLSDQQSLEDKTQAISADKKPFLAEQCEFWINFEELQHIRKKTLFSGSAKKKKKSPSHNPPGRARGKTAGWRKRRR